MTNPERVYADPSINMETEAYWEATKQNKLLLKKCDDCGETHWYPRAICPHCSSSNTCWYEGSGKGKIYSFSVMRRVEIPYVMAYVTLDEGVSLLTISWSAISTTCPSIKMLKLSSVPHKAIRPCPCFALLHKGPL